MRGNHLLLCRAALMSLLGTSAPSHAVALAAPPSAYCYQSGSGTTCDVAKASVSSGPAAGFGYSTLSYYLYVSSPLTEVPVHMQAALLAFERLDGTNVPYFYGNYPKYDVFSFFNVGTSSFYSGNPGVVFAGVGAAGTRSGLDGSDVGGQFGYSQAPTTVVTASADGQHVTQTTWLNLDTTVNLQANTYYLVQIGASAGVNYNSGAQLTNWTFAYADPFFEVAPEFLALQPQGATLALSVGVANSPIAAIPEPASIALFVAGGVFLVARRRPRSQRSIQLNLTSA